jgi:hypothetical protein
MSACSSIPIAISILANIYAAYLLFRAAEKHHTIKDRNERLETLLHQRTSHLDELKTIVAEWEEDENDYRNSVSHSRTQNIHQADKGLVRPQNEELHRTKPSPLY